MAKRGPNFSRFILNCGPSLDTDTDWSFGDAVTAQSEAIQNFDIELPGIDADLGSTPPEKFDLRQDWWKIRDQGRTGACVGFAVADGVLRWQFVNKGMIRQDELPSPRFVWMANKETDDITRYPTTFLEPAGTSTKLGLRIAQRYGCVLEHMLPMGGKLSLLRPNVFYSIAAQFRITAYYNLGYDLDHWRAWIAFVGPVLTRLNVDSSWKGATAAKGKLATYNDSKTFGGHAVCLVGYTADHFIVRNSWGDGWGDNGFAYASNEYAAEAFTEAYGAVL